MQRLQIPWSRETLCQVPSPKLHNPHFRRLPLLMCNPRSCSNPPFCLWPHSPFHLQSLTSNVYDIVENPNHIWLLLSVIMLIQTIHPNLAIEFLYLHTQADGNLWSLSTLLNNNQGLHCKLDSLFWPLGHMCVSNGTIHPILAKLGKGAIPEVIFSRNTWKIFHMIDAGCQ